jgi:hypothetical protein
MSVIAKALVMAVQYVADRNEDNTEDDDVELLERIAAMLQESSKAERKSLLEAARELKLPDWPKQIGIDR